MKPGSAGGRACAVIQKQKALERYLKNPAICKICGKAIPLDITTQKAGVIRRRKVCSQECYKECISKSNKKRSPSVRVELRCPTCSDIFVVIKESRLSQKYCSQRCSKGSSLIESGTQKGDLLERKKCRQYTGVAIRRNAKKVFAETGRPYQCHICSYSIKVGICHIKPVKSFSNTATLGEINHPNNLVALCANHHWELDHDMLDEALLLS